VDAEDPRLVARGGNDPTHRGPTDDHGLPTELGTIALLDGGEEGVEISVEDGASEGRGGTRSVDQSW
jgi:hypothetical protein